MNHPGAADIKIQLKSPEFLLDMRYFCNFSLVSLGIRPRSRRCAERTRQGEGRWSHPPKTALERSYLTENSSSANRILRPRRKKTPDRIPETNNDLTYSLYLYSFHSRYTALSYVWWMVCGWMAWSGLLVLVVKCVGKFSLPGGGVIILFFAL